MGRLLVLAKDWCPTDSPVKATMLAWTKGRIRLPAGAAFEYMPNAIIGDHPEYLLKFPPGSLQMLELMGLDINEKMLSTVGKVQGLVRLDLNETDLKDSDVLHFKDLQALRSLSLSKTLINGSCLNIVHNLQNVSALNISGNQLKRGVIKQLIGMKNLNQLFASHCGLTDADLLDLVQLPNMSELGISFNNGITDNGMPTLAKLKQLSFVDLDETAVTVRGVMALKGAPIGIMVLPPRCNNKDDLAKIKKVFPKAQVVFSHREKRVPIDF